MTAQSAENADFSSQEDEGPLPEGYSEALEIHKELAADLLAKALSREVYHCCDCTSWAGRCLKGKTNRIAYDNACLDFEKQLKTGAIDAREQ